MKTLQEVFRMLGCYIPGYRHTELYTLGRRIVLDLSRREHDILQRRSCIEALILYSRTRLVKEFMSGGYFSTGELALRLDAYLHDLLRSWFEARLNRKRCPWVSRAGRITFRGRRRFIDEFKGFPAPLLRIVRRRLIYIQMENNRVRDDYIRLERLFSVLREKGCNCFGDDRPYDRSVSFDQVMDAYLEFREDAHYITRTLQKLGILEVHRDVQAVREPVQPIADAKFIAKRKNGYFDLLNRFAQHLRPEERKTIVQDLLKLSIDLPQAREMITELSRRLRTLKFDEAWGGVLGTLAAERDPRHMGFKQMSPAPAAQAKDGRIGSLLSNRDGNHHGNAHD